MSSDWKRVRGTLLSGLLFLAACAPPPAPTATALTSTPTALPSDTAVSYPTLPPEWTATSTPTVTLTPIPPTPTITLTPEPTRTLPPTAEAPARIFTGTTVLAGQPFTLTDGLYVLAWTGNNPADAEFAIVLTAPDSGAVLTFVDALGPQTGASDLRIINTASLVLSVQAQGFWQLTIWPALEPTATPTPTLTPGTPGTPAATPSPVPT